MAKIKLTKGELKRQRDALRQFRRYLPTLQLKKQQLQMEILHAVSLQQERSAHLAAKKKAAMSWAGLLVEAQESIIALAAPSRVVTGLKNIAGVDVPVFQETVFPEADYDLFLTAPWVDHALEALREIVSLVREIEVIERSVEILKHELRITAQRVNLFEKVKIPAAEEAIRSIKIYIGDQMANAVGRSKVAKRKIDEFYAAEVAA